MGPPINGRAWGRGCGGLTPSARAKIGAESWAHGQQVSKTGADARTARLRRSGTGACDRVPVACVLAGEDTSEAPDKQLVGGQCSAGGDRILDRVPAGHLTSSAAGIAPPKRSTLQSAFAQSGYISTTSCVVS